ncbi:Invasion protein IalB, involved in pathogenesis [Arsukibacterium tuosuense]|uniref:Invasion protein IalB, involved in pathogenesis n=1 Tax=Arsukibacterium tuosuense TaxID=1323745 RepID=A0A285JKN4_9GAMM|nr:invasion associated locus B family protein [Arsukibacterium tuosuense]SNY60623.1 Invasion protein IalB, involved in pathogenesis [Arsukibacterium tuosuense]
MANITFYQPFSHLKSLAAMALLTLSTALASPAAVADDAKADVTEFGDWRAVCRDQCVIAQGLQNPEQPGLIYSSQVSYVSNSSDPVLQLNLPLGIYLPPGVAIDIGENKHRAPVTVCLPEGCKVLLVLSPEVVKQLQDNAAYTVQLFVTEQSPRQLKFSLRGFSDALASLTAD